MAWDCELGQKPISGYSVVPIHRFRINFLDHGSVKRPQDNLIYFKRMAISGIEKLQIEPMEVDVIYSSPFPYHRPFFSLLSGGDNTFRMDVAEYDPQRLDLRLNVTGMGMDPTPMAEMQGKCLPEKREGSAQ